MKLLKIGPSVNAVIAEASGAKTRDDLLTSEFSKVPSYIVYFQVDNSVRPVAQPRVKISVSLIEKDRLDEMERRDDTTWFSPMEVVHKGTNDFRIVIEMRSIPLSVPFPSKLSAYCNFLFF